MQKVKNKITAVLLCIFIFAFSLSVGAYAAENEPVLVAGGQVVGIKVECDGVLVAGISADKGDSPAVSAGIRAGDIITNVGSKRIESISQFREEMEKWDGGTVTLRVMRGERTLQFSVMPREDEDGKAELGVWLRDGMAGIGTLTFFDPETGLYGALGHSVNDVDTGVILPLRDGVLMNATLSGVKAGEAGKPGELLGSFDLNSGEGSINSNTSCGIFGVLSPSSGLVNGEKIPAAEKSEIKTGEATVLSCVDGTIREYSVEISRVYPGDCDGRDMLITVTDPELIKQTGGIVQGMSGSPIIQNGKLIGAVTHVLVNDPCKGYAISIETMLNAAKGE